MKCCQSGYFSDEIKNLQEAFKALADTNRLRIVCLLAKKEHCVCELEKELSLPQNLVSHHLSVLKEVDLVNSRKETTFIYYRLNLTKMEKAWQTFKKLWC